MTALSTFSSNILNQTFGRYLCVPFHFDHDVFNGHGKFIFTGQPLFQRRNLSGWVRWFPILWVKKRERIMGSYGEFFIVYIDSLLSTWVLRFEMISSYSAICTSPNRFSTAWVLMFFARFEYLRVFKVSSMHCWLKEGVRMIIPERLGGDASRTLCAKRTLLEGDTAAIITVLQFPPKLSFSSRVSLLELIKEYGMAI